MTIGEFVKELKKKHITIKPTYTPNGHEKVAALSKYFDYECGFKKDGGCKMYRKSLPMCCCSGCYKNLGFLNEIPLDKIEYFAKKFKKDTGFWTKKGCSLDRKYRSDECLRYTCSKKLRENPLYKMWNIIIRMTDNYTKVNLANELEKLLKDNKDNNL